MTEIWVAEYEGTRLVRADSIYAIDIHTSGSDAIVTVQFPDDQIIVAKQERVSQPGPDFDESAVRHAGDVMVRALLKKFSENPQGVPVCILDWASEPWS